MSVERNSFALLPPHVKLLAFDKNILRFGQRQTDFLRLFKQSYLAVIQFLSSLFEKGAGTFAISGRDMRLK